MIAVVSEAAVVAPGDRLGAFVQRARRGHARAGRRRALAVVGAPLLAVAALVCWLMPAWMWPCLATALVVVLLAIAIADRRGRRTDRTRLLQGLEGELPHAAATGDALAAWLEQSVGEARQRPMAQWLANDLAATLTALPPQSVRRVGHRPLGRIRGFVPLAVVAWLAWLLLQFGLPPLPGLLGGAPRADRGGAGGVGETPTRGNDPPQEREPKSPTALPPPPEPEPPPQPPPPPEPEPPSPPLPVLDLPLDTGVVVPQFVDDGPTRKLLAQRALLPDSGAGAEPPPASTGAARTGSSPPEQTPRRQFERAAERAARARHVPPHEQAIVRRFFARLQQEAK